MNKLFQSQDRQGFLVNIDINEISFNELAKDSLLNWLENNHNNIYWDIEANEGGNVRLENYTDGLQIVFSGDNGLFILEEIEIETVKF